MRARSFMLRETAPMDDKPDDDVAVGLRLIQDVAEIADPVAQRESVDEIWKCQQRLSEQERYADALRLVDGLLAWRLGQEPSEERDRAMAYTMLRRTQTLRDLERFGEAATQADELVRRYASDWASASSARRRYAANALYWKGASLSELERWPEALLAFDELIGHAEAVPAGARVWVARAFEDRGHALWEMGQPGQASEAYAEGISAFAADEDPKIGWIVEGLTLHKALVLAELERMEEATALYDRLIARQDPLEPRFVAVAYHRKVDLLVARREYDAAISTVDAFVERFGSSDDPSIRLYVARSISQKIGVLKHVGFGEAASYAAEQLVDRYGADLDPQIESIVAPHAHRLGRGRSRLRFRGLG